MLIFRSASIALALVAACFIAPQQTKAEQSEDTLLELASRPWTGDLDEMVERGFIRVVTAYNPLFFSYDEEAKPTGLVAEMAREFEQHLNDTVVPKGKRLNVIVFPAPRDKMLDYVVEGRADIADANLTITEERSEAVSFAKPLLSDVSEIVVTGPEANEAFSFDDLKLHGVHVRASSSYFSHLSVLNEKRGQESLSEIPVLLADERIEDHDLLDLVDKGILPATVVDSHKAKLWQGVFKNIVVHDDLVVNEDGEISWALRRDSPKLLAAVNSFVDIAKKGTLLGNVLIDRYFSDPEGMEVLRNPDGKTEILEAVEVIKRYAGEYDFDWLMILSQAFQESKLDQGKRSKAGAIGVMQVLPSTASDPNVDIDDIERLENNVHAGVRYLRFLRDRYFSDPELDPVDKVLFSFAAYNAGPRNISRARSKAEQLGFDPNVWFGHVEVAAAKTISHEPAIYVRNIFRNYVAYGHLATMRSARDESLEDQEN